MAPRAQFTRAEELPVHPYKPLRRHQLKPGDLPQRLQFCNWLTERSDEDMLDILVSEEANFQLKGNVNSQNTRCYDELKASSWDEGGRPQ